MRFVIIRAVAVLALCFTKVLDAAPQVLAVEGDPQACIRVQGTQLGTLPLTVEVGGRAVHFTEWITSDQSSTALVGFALQLPDQVSFSVEAGDRVFQGTSPRWLHPLGVWGPHVHGVDAITFCVPQVNEAKTLASAQ